MPGTYCLKARTWDKGGRFHETIIRRAIDAHGVDAAGIVIKGRFVPNDKNIQKLRITYCHPGQQKSFACAKPKADGTFTLKVDSLGGELLVGTHRRVFCYVPKVSRKDYMLPRDALYQVVPEKLAQVSLELPEGANGFRLYTSTSALLPVAWAFASRPDMKIVQIEAMPGKYCLKATMANSQKKMIVVEDEFQLPTDDVSAVTHSSKSAALHRRIIELFRLMGIQKNIRRQIDIMVEIYAKKPATSAMAPVFREFFQKHMGWESIKDDMTKMYVEAFTAKEVEDMIKFYKTPTGKKLIEKQPELQRKAMEIGQQRVQANMAELQQMLRDAAEKRKRSQP